MNVCVCSTSLGLEVYLQKNPNCETAGHHAVPQLMLEVHLMGVTGY